MPSTMKPEEKARVWIDSKLREAGWEVLNRDELTYNSNAVAIREGLMKGNQEADYLLLVNGKAIGVVEAKREEISIENEKARNQAQKYSKLLQADYPSFDNVLKFVYLSNGKQIAFCDLRKEDGHFEIQKRFYRPRELLKMLGVEKNFNSFPFLDPKGLRTCQYEAISNFENSLKAGNKRALMVLATGSGKTFTSCMIAYRLLNYTPVKRILYLVDRNVLGTNAMDNFSRFNLTESGQVFTALHHVEKLTTKPVNENTEVYIGTIQRLYSQLGGKDIPSDEESGDVWREDGEHSSENIEIPSLPHLPADFYDAIIVDECHRSIYSDWQKVLTYFKDAILIGLTATPIEETEKFFNQNIVAKYSLEDSIADGVNVMHRVYRIHTKLSDAGGQINVGDDVELTENATNKTRLRHEGYNTEFTQNELNRTIIVGDNIRKILQEYKNVVYSQMYPDREPNFDYLPKTLIFAKSEEHAKDIVKIAKEVFEKTNDDKFVQRITYTAGDSQALIRSFNNDVEFRIAVTVTLVATGTDVPPLEVLLFLNNVRSSVLYQQMKGRGVRTIVADRLKKVTPNALSKDLFFLVDAVGVTETEKIVPDPKGDELVLNPTLKTLIEWLSQGKVSDENLHLFAGKCSVVGNRGDREELDEFVKHAGYTPIDLAKKIYEAFDTEALPSFVSANEENSIRKALIANFINDLKARKKLIEIAAGYIKRPIDMEDEILASGFTFEQAERSVSAFERYVNAKRDEVEALRLIYG